jgi:hypothetical protein
MEAVSAAGGNIEIMFLQQMGDDPFISTPERTAQIGGVAGCQLYVRVSAETEPNRLALNASQLLSHRVAPRSFPCVIK